jgi:hypothetical protein
MSATYIRDLEQYGVIKETPKPHKCILPTNLLCPGCYVWIARGETVVIDGVRRHLVCGEKVQEGF